MTAGDPSQNSHLHRRLRRRPSETCCRGCGAWAARACGPCCTASTSSRPFSTLFRRPAASQTSSCSRSSAPTTPTTPTTPTCAGSPAWAGGRTAPCTRRLRCAQRRGCPSGCTSSARDSHAWTT
eukprot:365167-Chlamydomonas_euryale.AAC.6